MTKQDKNDIYITSLVIKLLNQFEHDEKLHHLNL